MRFEHEFESFETRHRVNYELAHSHQQRVFKETYVAILW